MAAKKMPEPKLDPAQSLHLMLAADRRKRTDSCQADIQAALETYRCQLVAVPVITPDGRLAANIILQAVDGEKQ